VLGTAGHIDHGKTALVRALTGVDTDRLQEEKARGITIELGFAELASDGRPHFGVVDVPGHEAFVRAMVAGAAGMDVVLLVVASDEGVMPQTREHLAIVDLLGVPELVVALTKADLVEPDWLELVHADVAEALAGTPYEGAPRVPTSAVTGMGLDALLDALSAAAGRVSTRTTEDLTRLPLDRVFTIQGTGTVVTGTMWSGSVSVGDRVRVLPDGLEARIRSVQVHGAAVESAVAGDRTALALAGQGADRDLVGRGATLVTAPGWEPSRMLTAHVRMLPGPGWSLEHNQRVHVHLGTAEVRARCALLEDEPLGPGGHGWVQLRLEEPLLARGRDRFVVRAYSPVTTIGGGVVAETHPPKRNRLTDDERALLADAIRGAPERAVEAHLELSGWSGADLGAVPIHVGLSPGTVGEAVAALDGTAVLLTPRRGFSAAVRAAAERLVAEAVEEGHGADPLRASVPLARVRAAIPGWASSELADAVIGAMVVEGRLEAVEGGVRRPGHEATLTADQERAIAELTGVLASGGLAAPWVEELPEPLSARSDLRALLRRLEESGVVRQVADGLYVPSDELEGAASRIREALGGRTRLGPADFRDVLPVTRKHLIPLLNFFDGEGTTVRGDGGRDVPVAE
jgi:selenocysteine-specific elongation factor